MIFIEKYALHIFSINIELYIYKILLIYNYKNVFL